MPDERRRPVDVTLELPDPVEGNWQFLRDAGPVVSDDWRWPVTDLLVIHDLGAPEGGRPWRDAFAGWPGSVSAPDLPGHVDEPSPLGGHYEVGDAVFHLAGQLPTPGQDDLPVIVGVGTNGHAARVLALAGRAAGLVLVDGVGGPWLDVPARNAALRDVRRQILATPDALSPHSSGTTDVRATVHLPLADRGHAVETLAAVPVPTLLVETPDCPIDDTAEVAAAIGHGTHVRLADSAPATVARAVADWWATVAAD